MYFAVASGDSNFSCQRRSSSKGRSSICANFFAWGRSYKPQVANKSIQHSSLNRTPIGNDFVGIYLYTIGAGGLPV